MYHKQPNEKNNNWKIGGRDMGEAAMQCPSTDGPSSDLT